MKLKKDSFIYCERKAFSQRVSRLKIVKNNILFITIFLRQLTWPAFSLKRLTTISPYILFLGIFYMWGYMIWALILIRAMPLSVAFPVASAGLLVSSDHGLSILERKVRFN